MKAVDISANKSGRRFALISDDEAKSWADDQDRGTFGVWSECSSYSPRARSGIAKTWRVIQMGLTLDAAGKLFRRKLAGKEKP